jgi:hypothetical protein
MAGERWLVRIAGRRDGELFKMHSAGKWVWLQARDWMPQAAGERVRANIHRNGYLHVPTLEDARTEMARRVGVAAE